MSKVPCFSSLLGIILIVLGVGGYFASGMASITAMIPAFFGILFLVCGLLGRKEKFLKHAMHGAALFALIGLAGSFSGLLSLFSWMAGSSLERPMAAVAQAVMAILCVAFLVVAISSFIQVRKERRAEQA